MFRLYFLTHSTEERCLGFLKLLYKFCYKNIFQLCCQDWVSESKHVVFMNMNNHASTVEAMEQQNQQDLMPGCVWLIHLINVYLNQQTNPSIVPEGTAPHPSADNSLYSLCSCRNALGSM